MIYLTLKEKKNIIKETNPTALFLFEYYLSKMNHSDLNDASVAKALEMPKATIKNNRLMLEKANLFYQDKGKLKISTVCINFLGKHKVIEQRYFKSLFGYDNVKEILKNDVEYEALLKLANLDDKLKQDILDIFMEVIGGK